MDEMTGTKKLTRELTMRFAGRLVKHLGLQMYSGAVPAIAELVANAWDAEASRVDITIPFGEALSPKSVITVVDNGHGMAFEECQEEYLVVGRDRRQAEGNKSKNKVRLLMAHKGIGKLAGFGIANIVTVKTVKDGRVTEFLMNYDDIVKDGEFVKDYKPRVLADGRSSEPDGTTVVLSGIKITRAVPDEQFRRSMLRRFAVYSDKFQVFINGNPLKKEEAAFQFRFPKNKDKWRSLNVDGKPIQWWVGFTKETINDEESRGITVIARGKLVQAPWFFGLSGGVYGQHGLQYMTGEVIANWLDDKEDLVATDRAGVMWEHPFAHPLQQWGQTKVKELLEKWVEGRTKEKIEHLKQRTPFIERVEKFPPRERRELTKAIQKLAEIPTIDDQRLQDLVEFLVRAYENEHFLEVIRQLNTANPSALAEVLKLLAEWDVLEAVATAQIVRGRLEIIDKFEKLIQLDAREKPEMHDFLEAHPWLIDPTWTMVDHERGLDRVLEDHFGKKVRKGTRERLDFICMADTSRVLVIEIKRPGLKGTKEELRQLADYVDYLKKREKGSDPERPSRTVHGYLIVGRLDEDAVPERERLHKDGVFVRMWDQLVRTAREAHKQFFDVVKKRAPVEDPRIKALEMPAIGIGLSKREDDTKNTKKV